MFKLEDGLTYLMPAHFGGNKFDPEIKSKQKVTSMSINYETDKKLLENYLPEVFELKAPVIHVAFSEFTEINWMMGGHYNLIDISVPVLFNGKKDQLDGNYSLVIWENNTTPILTGREQTGMPKIFADIENLHIIKSQYATNASYQGNTFLNMDFEVNGKLTGDDFESVKSLSSSINAIGWRYIPKVGVPGAELSQFILFPQGMEVEEVHFGKGNIKWTKQTPMQNPSQFNIINSLAALPKKKILNALVSKGRINLRTFDSKIIE